MRGTSVMTGREVHWSCLRTFSAFPVILTLISFSFATSTQAQDDYADELPRIAPTEASETLKHFAVAEGFQIELVASEPLVASPVAIEWDVDGAMYVCEMRGYSEDRDEKLSRIRRLTDSDQDGTYDHAVVFVDGLLWPTAIFPFDGGLFVGDAPDLLYCKDTDGDGVADLKKVVLTGFGTSNVQGLMNSFRWGLDNRIHVACSSVGGKIYRPGDTENAVDVRGRDISFDPRTFRDRANERRRPAWHVLRRLGTKVRFVQQRSHSTNHVRRSLHRTQSLVLGFLGTRFHRLRRTSGGSLSNQPG